MQVVSAGCELMAHGSRLMVLPLAKQNKHHGQDDASQKNPINTGTVIQH